MGTNEFLQSTQTKLGVDLLSEAENGETNVDVVFVIDATESMKPMIDTVKQMAINLYDDIAEGLKKFNLHMKQCRAKVIAFRDYFCDGEFAMSESDFFFLPDEKENFKEFVLGIEAKGGGDEPESSLEALALAMKSDWTQDGSHNRHVIVMLTDASAHNLETAKELAAEGKKNPIYPNKMLSSYSEMYKAWAGNETMLQPGLADNLMIDKNNVISEFMMNRRARRLILFAPDAKPWSDMTIEFEQCISSPVIPGKGCDEVDNAIIITTICKSCV